MLIRTEGSHQPLQPLSLFLSLFWFVWQIKKKNKKKTKNNSLTILADPSSLKLVGYKSISVTAVN